MINEHREYFRIDEKAFIEHLAVDNTDNNDVQALFNNNAPHKLLEDLHDIDSQLPQSLHNTVDGNAELATYLRTQNRKIELLANALASVLDKDDCQEQAITLSEGGLAFNSQNALEEGSYLAIRLRLSSDALVLCSYAKVMQCLSQSDGQWAYTVAVEFIDLADDMRDTLAKHNIRIQQERVRQAKA